MEPLKICEILEAVHGKLLSGDKETLISEISTDSRKIGHNMFFIPLKGEKFDGHNFIKGAFENGAVGCITEKSIDINDKCIIKVDDSKRALSDIAAYYKSKYKIPFVAITGSVGKTSTKEMIASVLQTKYRILKTSGNYNNDIGLPLTVLRLNKSHQIGVVEVGMSGFGEIKRLVNIIKPKVGVITNIGLSHIGNLGSKENILKAKMELFEYFEENNYGILNGDNDLLWSKKNELWFNNIYIGINNSSCDLKAYNIKSLGQEGCMFNIEINGKEYNIRILSPGIHNIYNALEAIAVGLYFKVSPEDIVRGLKNYVPEKMRMNLIYTNELHIINDCYNASPDSMKAALNVLKEIGKSKRKIAVLGDMLEMGKWAEKSHIEIGKFVYKLGINKLFTLGKNGSYIAKGALDSGMNNKDVYSFNKIEGLNDSLLSIINNGDIVLVKGSRGMNMERIVENLKNNKGE